MTNSDKLAFWYHCVQHSVPLLVIQPPRDQAQKVGLAEGVKPTIFGPIVDLSSERQTSLSMGPGLMGPRFFTSGLSRHNSLVLASQCHDIAGYDILLRTDDLVAIASFDVPRSDSQPVLSMMATRRLLELVSTCLSAP
jgi:hypothetical protein